MATKAELFKAKERLSKPKRAPAPKRPRRDVPVDTAAPGVSATNRKAGKRSAAERDEKSAGASRKAVVLLEDSAEKPSRKSTRKSANRSRASSNLERKERRERRKPVARAEAAQAKAKTVAGRRRG